MEHVQTDISVVPGAHIVLRLVATTDGKIITKAFLFRKTRQGKTT